MKPSIVLIGLDQIFLDETVQGLVGEGKPNENNVIEWTIDTKYYTADVDLCPVNTKMLVDQSVAESAQVLIVLLDPSEINSQSKLDSWLPFLSVLDECETKLLVTRNMDALSNTLSRTDVKQWCTKHEYELLELEKTTTSETDEEEDEEEEEEDNHHRREINRNLAQQLKAKLNFDQTNDADHSAEQNEQIDSSSSTTNNHHETDAFGMENIFEQMRRYKEDADQLTGEERKQFAEKVILSLWKNIGDDDEEESDE